MNLPTTRFGSTLPQPVLTSTAFSQALEVCGGSLEAVKYLAARLPQKIPSNKDTTNLLLQVDAYENLLKRQEAQQEARNPWTGDPRCLRTDFENLQIESAAQARAKIVEAGKQSKEPIAMDVAFGDIFLRGYLRGGLPLDTETENACDDLFNAWLADHNLSNRDGEIFKADEQGHEIGPADIDMRAFFYDPEQGFPQYLATRKLAIEIREQPYPKQAQKSVAPAEQPSSSVEKQQPTPGANASADTPQAPSTP